MHSEWNHSPLERRVFLARSSSLTLLGALSLVPATLQLDSLSGQERSVWAYQGITLSVAAKEKTQHRRVKQYVAKVVLRASETQVTFDDRTTIVMTRSICKGRVCVFLQSDQPIRGIRKLTEDEIECAEVLDAAPAGQEVLT
jgi:hypothetical protein